MTSSTLPAQSAGVRTEDTLKERMNIVIGGHVDHGKSTVL